jgi:hypothetical protein
MMLQPGKMNEIGLEIMKFCTSVVALQEIRWKGQGQINKKDYSLFFSGPKYRTGQLGTGFMINNKMKKHLIEFEPTGERLCKIRFKGRFRNITMLSAHAPTEEKDDTEKEEFDDLLFKTCDQIPKYELIILGNFNAKIGRENYIAQVAFKYTIHNETSANGNLLYPVSPKYKLQGHRLTSYPLPRCSKSTVQHCRLFYTVRFDPSSV